MSHLDRSALAAYNSLTDPCLQQYFNNERIRSHLKHAGLISRHGEIVPEGEYRARLAHREHVKHVRHMLAENIVNRAVDMERTRQAELRRQYEMMAKAAQVNNMRESRKRGANQSGFMSMPNDIAFLSVESSCTQLRPKSANHQNETHKEDGRIPRLQSANFSDDQSVKYFSDSVERPSRRLRRRGRRSSHRSKFSNMKRSSSAQRAHSPSKGSDSSATNACQITMVYYGPNTKVDYDHLVFDEADEVTIMQQHCGGENLIVYKNFLKPGDVFTFKSRRHSNYPFGLSLYAKGVIDSRISTCCEYKHRHGVRLGGDRGHFAIKSVQGSKACIKCSYEKQARLKRYDRSPKEKQDPITIPLPASEEHDQAHTPVRIPVQRISKTHDEYQEDFDESDKQKPSARDSSSVASSQQRLQSSKRKSPSSDSTLKGVIPRASPIPRKESSTRSDLSFNATPRKESHTKTWQIIFHTGKTLEDLKRRQNSSFRENTSLRYSFIANDGNDETETREIDMKDLTRNARLTKQYSFPTKLKNIGKPEQIRLKVCLRDGQEEDDDDDEDNDKQWYLDHIEVIDPETQSHLIFPHAKWIKFSQEVLLASRDEQRKRRSSESSNASTRKEEREVSPKIQPVAQASARSKASSSSSKKSQTGSDARPQKTEDGESRADENATPRNEDTTETGRVRYTVVISTSADDDGCFNANRNSRIFLRLNDHGEETYITNEKNSLCPAFESSEEKEFEVDLVQNIDEVPTKLTIGYINNDSTAQTWKLNQVTLINPKTSERTTFQCTEPLLRNKSDFRAERSFLVKSKDSPKESAPRNEVAIGKQQNDTPNEAQTTETQQKRIDTTPREKSPSFESMTDDDAHYRKIFDKLDPTHKLGLGSSPPSPPPQSRRASSNTDGRKRKSTDNNVTPLVGVGSLTNETPRSNDQLDSGSLPRTTVLSAHNAFAPMYRQTADSDENDN